MAISFDAKKARKRRRLIVLIVGCIGLGIASFGAFSSFDDLNTASSKFFYVGLAPTAAAASAYGWLGRRRHRRRRRHHHRDPSGVKSTQDSTGDSEASVSRDGGTTETKLPADQSTRVEPGDITRVGERFF
jgi:hypothetical protein